MKMPRDFKEWLGPWVLGTIWESGPDGESTARVWSRMYREQSHCGREGCCELEYPFMGPQIGPTHKVEEPSADLRHAAVWDWIAKQDAALGEPWGD